MEDRTHYTIIGPLNPKLYGDNLQRLHYATRQSIQALHNLLEEQRRHGENLIPKDLRRNAVKGSKAGPKNIVYTYDDSSNGDESPEQKTTFCYFCSTFEEHQRHAFQQQQRIRRRRTVTAQPRIKYVAPPPVVRKKPVLEEQIDSVLYRVVVRTGCDRNAGSAAKISMRMVGVSGKTNFRPLRKMWGSLRFAFRAGTEEVLYWKTPTLGDLLYIELMIESDSLDKIERWLLEAVVITNTTDNTNYCFPLNDWLSTSARSQKKRVKIEVCLAPGATDVAWRDYTITVYTGDEQFAGTDAQVDVWLFGERGQTGKLRIDGRKRGVLERGSKDTFSLRCPHLGRVCALRVASDSGGLAPDWLLDKVSVSTFDKEKGAQQTYDFECGEWFNKKSSSKDLLHPDRPFYTPQASRHNSPQKKRRTPHSPPFQRRPLSSPHQNTMDRPSRPNAAGYEVVVVTGDKVGAGTDSQIYLTLFSEYDQTERVLLNKHCTSLNAASTEKFIIHVTPAIDNLVKVKVEQVPTKSISNAWYLEKMTMRALDEPDEIYEFLHSNWLSQKPSTGSGYVTEVFASAGGSRRKKMKNWRVTITTGNDRGSGTGANVHITFYGKKGTSQKLLLNAAGETFESGSEVTFTVTADDVGTVDRLRVEQDCTGFGCGWLLDKVEIANADTGKDRLVMPCGQWLDTAQPWQDLYPAGRSYVSNKLAEWEIKVFTSQGVRGAGTDSNVFLTLGGSEGYSEKVGLRDGSKDCFETGQEDTFYITTSRIGRLQKIFVEHDGKGFGAAWHLDRVEIRNLTSPPEAAAFVVRDWVPDGGLEVYPDRVQTRAMSTTSQSTRPQLLTDWEVLVTTGDCFGAGTNANVFITLWDERTSSERIPLRCDTSSRFEAGQTDRFFIKAPVRGPISRIRVEHDGSGIGAGWFLDKVELIKCADPKQRSLFRCNAWLATDEGERVLFKEMFAEGATTRISLKDTGLNATVSSVTTSGESFSDSIKSKFSKDGLFGLFS